MKIFAVGMNYLMHTKELDGREYTPQEPVIFTKADSALLKDRKPFFVPDDMGRIDYEAEIVVRICRLGKAIPERFAHRYYDAVTIGLDFTAREMQAKARIEGLPWTICKGFDGSAIIGEWLPLSDNIQSLHFHLDKNGQTVQQGFSGDMLFKVDEIISYLSRYFTLKTGDLLFTGTPSGVGPVAVGDLLEGFIEDRRVLECQCK
ncbi:fumarylacetoacetate hydrolase family protein [Prevotella sp. E9-3]|uniref:fumarylacetoacetate hydrolase family protein n=1 Tax=Prevotella sp. E9-3 TaxID=2913621 RepID=UPI001EDB6899|nr:fumarylacetoacetate hydrolase family protein [Prevotella sp. E9-3]UKK47182.1 fumarylacetoacetate hydrolase family protein [Prevotella sp. E9-3]